MHRSIHTFFGGVLSAAAFFCTTHIGSACSDSYFQSKIAYIDNYDPRSYNSAPTPSSGTVACGYISALTAAANYGPPKLKDQLCTLDYIFIDSTPCTVPCLSNSWGLRYRSTSSGTRYVAISKGFLDWNPTLDDYETALINGLLGLPNPLLKAFVNSSFTSSGANSNAMALLAALAHELGHVRWYDILYPFPQPTFPNHAFYTSQLCGGNFFISWVASSNISVPPYFREFLRPSARHNPAQQVLDRHAKSDSDLGDIDHDFGSGYYANILRKLYNIYRQDASWASLHAAASPDEDFVENMYSVS
jgi:hypothetical protein